MGWGTSSVFAGPAARRGPPIVVTLWSQVLGALAGGPVLFLVASRMTPSALWHGAIAGSGAGISLLLLYSSAQHLYVGIASALSAVVSCAVPVAVSAAFRSIPLRGVVGVAVCVLALLAVARWQADSRVRPAVAVANRVRGELAGVTLAGASGLAMSAYYLGLAGTSPRVQLGEAIESRAVASIVLVAVALCGQRSALAPGRPALLAALPVTLFGLVGALCYATAVSRHNVAVIVPIVSMSPVVTVVAAWIALDEHVSRRQLGALALAMAGIVLVTV